MPIRRSHAKAAVGLFWAVSWLFWPKWAQKCLEASIKNPATFVSQEFSPRTAAKIMMEKY